MPGYNPVKVLDVAPMVYFVPLNTMSYIVAVCTGFQLMVTEFCVTDFVIPVGAAGLTAGVVNVLV